MVVAVDDSMNTCADLKALDICTQAADVIISQANFLCLIE